MERDRIIERIRKLLRLSRSENPYEAALAAERVQRMLSEYNLTLEGIVDEETEKARQINRKTRKDLEEWAHILAGRTASVFDCQYFHDPNTGETSFVGVGADPEVCGWMYGYLYKTLLRTHARPGPQAPQLKVETGSPQIFSSRCRGRHQLSDGRTEKGDARYFMRAGAGQGRAYSGRHAG